MTEKIPKIRFRDGEARGIQDHIGRMCERYIYAEPFPIIDDNIAELTNDTIPMSVWKHIEHVVKFDKQMIHTRSSMTTVVSGISPQTGRLYIYDNDSKVHFYESRSRILQPSSEFYGRTYDWMNDVIERMEKTKAFTAHVGNVFHYSNTPGQVKTMCPALVELLPARMHESLKNSTRATRWPTRSLNRTEFLEKGKQFENMVVLLKMVDNASSRKRRRFQIKLD